MTQPNPHDYNAIRNALALYSIALDTKDFSLFPQIFLEDVLAIYPFSPEPIHGSSALAQRIQARLKPVVTQHALTTHHLVILPRDEEGKLVARSMTYFTGVHLGQGKWEGELVTAYGKYTDELVCLEGEEGEWGASGQWRVRKREVKFFGRVGEEGVMEGKVGL